MMDKKLSELKAVERFDADIEENGGEPFAVWVTAINGSHVFAKDYDALLAELEREREMRAQNLEIKTLLAEKVKGLETKLWDSQQLVDAKAGSQIELRSQISGLEESNRKDMAWRGERLCELEDSLEAAQKRIAELEDKLATPVRLPDIRSDDYHETGWFQHMKYYRDVERSLRAAGLAVDEQGNVRC